jgi:hypothetical protein
VGIDADPRGGANQVRDGFSRPETHTVETSTDTDGHFILADLPAGELLLRIESAGSRLVDQRIHLAAGQRRELLPSALVIDDHRTSLSGTVSALAPQPEELSLLLHEPGHGLVSTTSPDPSGAFRIWGLRRDADYALEVRSADAVLWRGAVTLDDAPLAIR